MSTKLVVISAVGLNQAGTLMVAKKVLAAADKVESCRVIALVFDKTLYPRYKRIKLISVPEPKKSWLARLFFEFYTSYKISLRLNPDVWFALHDITPRVKVAQQYVYCHNSTPLYSAGIRDLIFQPTVFVFSLFYKFLYKINIYANRAVFVQQCHMRNYFQSSYFVDNVVVARPASVNSKKTKKVATNDTNGLVDKGVTRLFYPTMPRTFKNIEVLIKTAKILQNRGFGRFEIRISLSTYDSLYARYLALCARSVESIRFIGRLSHAGVLDEYRRSDALVFPSKLETWGLPLTEAKSIGLPILAADLPYARETLGVYDKVNFFNPQDPHQLADLIEALTSGGGFEGSDFSMPLGVPVLNGWDELFAFVTAQGNPQDLNE